MDHITITGEDGVEVVQNSEQGVQNFESLSLVEFLDTVHWEDLQILRNIGEASSIRRVSAELSISTNTTRTRLSRIEEAVGSTLYVRDFDGLTITAEGRQLLQMANELRHVSANLHRGKGNNILVKSGEIRISISEGLGTFWLTPRLPELNALLPELTVSLDCTSGPNTSNMKDSDISIGFSKPDRLDAIVTKLATIHIIPFASDQYIRTYGKPKSLDDLVGHRCVQQDSPGMNYDAIKFFFGSEMLKDFVKIKFSSSYSLFMAVATGIGIGALPTYVRTISQKIHPLDLPIQLKFELWASFSHSSKHSQPVRTALQWLRNSFDSTRYPWFADEFVHPDAFANSFDDSQTELLFDHLID